MKKFLFSLLLVCTSTAFAEKFNFPDIGLTYEAPANFTQLSTNEIAFKFPKNADAASSYVVGDVRRATTIACGLKKQAVTPQQLPDVKKALEAQLPRLVPNLTWVQKKTISLNGREWVYLELTSSAIDTDIHNIMLITSNEGRMMVCNFNSTKENFKEMEAALHQSIESITISKPAPSKDAVVSLDSLNGNWELPKTNSSIGEYSGNFLLQKDGTCEFNVKFVDGMTSNLKGTCELKDGAIVLVDSSFKDIVPEEELDDIAVIYHIHNYTGDQMTLRTSDNQYNLVKTKK